MKKVGHPPHEPTKAMRDTVSLHAMVGTPQETIAQVLNIDSKTLRKYYRSELDTALAKANATIGGHLFNEAKNGNVVAQIFWLKTRGGFRENNNDQNTIDATPIETTFKVLPSKSDVIVTKGQG